MFFSHIINPLLTKLVRSRWLDIGLILFLRVYGPRRRLDHAKKELGQYPAILTSRLVNNPYILRSLYTSPTATDIDLNGLIKQFQKTELFAHQGFKKATQCKLLKPLVDTKNTPAPISVINGVFCTTVLSITFVTGIKY